MSVDAEREARERWRVTIRKSVRVCGVSAVGVGLVVREFGGGWSGAMTRELAWRSHAQKKTRLMEVLSILLATASAVPLRVSGLERGISKLAATSGVVAIDAENVRGKSGFRLNHNALLAATAEWTNAHKLRGRVVLVVDHGSSHQGMYLKRHGMAVVFAGPNQKADDVLARDVGYWSAVQRRDSIVVTADGRAAQALPPKGAL